MITDQSGMLLTLLAVLTFFAVVIGYCLALLRTKRAAKRVIEAERTRLRQKPPIPALDLQSAKSSISLSREPGVKADALKSKTQAQAARIKNLESQLRELQLALDGPSVWSREANLSVLPGGADERHVTAASNMAKAHLNDDTAVDLLPRELDIPTLAESEIPDSEVDHDFDTQDLDAKDIDTKDFDIQDFDIFRRKEGGAKPGE